MDFPFLFGGEYRKFEKLYYNGKTEKELYPICGISNGFGDFDITSSYLYGNLWQAKRKTEPNRELR